jgi:hypothetical protein
VWWSDAFAGVFAKIVMTDRGVFVVEFVVECVVKDGPLMLACQLSANRYTGSNLEKFISAGSPYCSITRLPGILWT